MEAEQGPESPSRSSRKDISVSPRKPRTEHVGGQPYDKAAPRRQFSLSALGEKVRSLIPRSFSRQQQSSTMGRGRRGSKSTSGGDTIRSPTIASQSARSEDVDVNADIDMGDVTKESRDEENEGDKDALTVGINTSDEMDIDQNEGATKDPQRATPVQALSPLIPREISPEEASIYNILLAVVEKRRKSGKEAPRVAVITDLAKDYDDLAALIVLKELHRLGVITLVGFVANLNPSNQRAIFGRGALDSLQLPDVKIASGTSGYTKKAYQGDDVKGGKSGKQQHKVLDYEFNGWTAKGMPTFPVQNPDDPMLTHETEGEKLLQDIFKHAPSLGKITLLLISSFEDIYTFSNNHGDLLKNGVQNIVLQGGYYINKENKLLPATDANNNRYDMEAAEKFHSFMQENEIPSAVYTKVAAFATPLYSRLFAELEETGHPLGKHLREVQVKQDLAFYRSACQPDKKKRFADYMDQKWYLKNKTSWFDNLDPNSPSFLKPDHPQYHDENAPYPQGQKVVPYLDKVVVYDALAALGSCGEDAVTALGILANVNDTQATIPEGTDSDEQDDNGIKLRERHKIIGNPGPPVNIGVDPKNMGLALSALLKGSFGGSWLHHIYGKGYNLCLRIEASWLKPKSPSSTATSGVKKAELYETRLDQVEGQAKTNSQSRIYALFASNRIELCYFTWKSIQGSASRGSNKL